MVYNHYTYGVATISRLLKFIGLFYRILQGSFAKETYKFKEPTNRSHPISNYIPSPQGPMGLLRLVGCLKLYVFFAKEPCKRDYALQKRPIIWMSLLIVATPYHNWPLYQRYFDKYRMIVVRKKESCICAKEACMYVKEIYIRAKETYICAIENCICAKETCICAKETCICVKETYV